MKETKETRYRIMINGIGIADKTGRNWRLFNEVEKDTILKEKMAFESTKDIVIYEDTTIHYERG